MYSTIKENKLEMLIDRNSKSVFKLAELMQMDKKEMFDALSAAYQNAIEENKLNNDDSGIYFKTDFCDVLLVRNQDFSSYADYYLTFKLYEKEKAVQSNIQNQKKISSNDNNYIEYDNLETFADFTNTLYLEEISSLAKKEKWSLNDDDKYAVLRNYLQYTFYKLFHEDKICINPANNFAAFNTGLCTSSYDTIYMCFTVNANQRDNAPKWKYAGVCTPAHSKLGKMLVSHFNPLPQKAEYFKNKQDIIYDTDKTLHIDIDHIIIERINRLPLNFLKQQLFQNEKAINIINTIEISKNANNTELYEKLGNIIKTSTQYYQCLANGFRSVTDRALKIVNWNNDFSVPCYHPKGKAMCFLLPLDFNGNGKPEAALVVSKTVSGNYIGQTILPIEQAYMDARLIKSMEISWLSI